MSFGISLGSLPCYSALRTHILGQFEATEQAEMKSGLVDLGRMREAERFVSLSTIPHLTNMVVAIEDRRFYRHPGFDIRGIVRAACVNTRHLAIKQGGSTITQQLARTLWLGRRRTIRRKTYEVFLALILEHQLPKDRILELYLNAVYWGRGVFGIHDAARTYFAKDPAALDRGESFFLAERIARPATCVPARVQRIWNMLMKLDIVDAKDILAARLSYEAVFGIRLPTLVPKAELVSNLLSVSTIRLPAGVEQ